MKKAISKKELSLVKKLAETVEKNEFYGTETELFKKLRDKKE